MAMAHRATEEAFLKPDKIGPRVLHRTSTLASKIPKAVKGFNSAAWERARNCVKNEKGLCVQENDKDKTDNKTSNRDSIEKEEL